MSYPRTNTGQEVDERRTRSMESKVIEDVLTQLARRCIARDLCKPGTCAITLPRYFHRARNPGGISGEHEIFGAANAPTDTCRTHVFFRTPRSAIPATQVHHHH